MDKKTLESLRIVYSTAKEHLCNTPDLSTKEVAELGEALNRVSNFIEIHLEL